MPNRPPVSEVAITVQLRPLGVATVSDAASFVEKFSDRFPTLQHATRLPSIDPKLPNIMPISTQVFAGGASLPRIWLITSDSHRVLQFQDERFGLNWRRMSPLSDDVEYPGYDNLLHEFTALFDEFSGWYASRFGRKPEPDAAELFYQDTVGTVKSDGSPRRLSEIFSFFEMRPSRKITGFHAGWVESIPGIESGHLVFEARAGALPDNTPAATAQFVARVAIDDSTGRPADWFNTSHDYVLDVFRSMIMYDSEVQR